MVFYAIIAIKVTQVSINSATNSAPSAPVAPKVEAPKTPMATEDDAIAFMEKLKEKGFDEPCFATFQPELSGFPLEDMEGKPTDAIAYNWKNSKVHESVICAPLWQQVIEWFLEKHQLYIDVSSVSQESWSFTGSKPYEKLTSCYGEDFYTYQDAREQAILKAIELI